MAIFTQISHSDSSGTLINDQYANKRPGGAIFLKKCKRPGSVINVIRVIWFIGYMFFEKFLELFYLKTWRGMFFLPPVPFFFHFPYPHTTFFQTPIPLLFTPYGFPHNLTPSTFDAPLPLSINLPTICVNFDPSYTFRKPLNTFVDAHPPRT